MQVQSERTSFAEAKKNSQPRTHIKTNPHSTILFSGHVHVAVGSKPRRQRFQDPVTILAGNLKSRLLASETESWHVDDEKSLFCFVLCGRLCVSAARFGRAYTLQQ
jgi:hypothetical protein